MANQSSTVPGLPTPALTSRTTNWGRLERRRLRGRPRDFVHQRRRRESAGSIRRVRRAMLSRNGRWKSTASRSARCSSRLLRDRSRRTRSRSCNRSRRSAGTTFPSSASDPDNGYKMVHRHARRAARQAADSVHQDFGRDGIDYFGEVTFFLRSNQVERPGGEYSPHRPFLFNQQVSMNLWVAGGRA